MSVDIVCFYVDLGRPYAPLLQRMAASAHAKIPDARVVLFTDQTTPDPGGFDQVIRYPKVVTRDNLCLERVRLIVSWMLGAQRPTIFVDPDIEFTGPVPLDGSFDVGLLWRKKADQPVNTGAILALPGHDAFWKHYGTIAVNLPQQVHGWWCDQLAFALLTGVCHKPDDRIEVDGARVWLMDAYANCSEPESAKSGHWALHYKGQRKGPGWESIFKSDAGNLSPDSAFVTV